jgi:hypothetical protein
MGRAPTTFHLYGQPDEEYEVFLPWFAETYIKTPHQAGYKLHVTVTTQHHLRLAGVILPTLRLLHTHHKVVLPGQYPVFNQTPQGGKFITVYAGPEAAAQRIIETIDPALARLRRGGVEPGPWPMNRQAAHGTPEDPVGTSGMISCLWLNNLKGA